ncbi:hypothetical protein [Streptomyces sp. NPDC058330]|uniref:hypothetical protein n=1 Tax=Streptomyces sp. NPDC058330 TaxID=3346449 RepID=UPI0036E7B251
MTDSTLLITEPPVVVDTDRRVLPTRRRRTRASPHRDGLWASGFLPVPFHVRARSVLLLR